MPRQIDGLDRLALRASRSPICNCAVAAASWSASSLTSLLAFLLTSLLVSSSASLSASSLASSLVYSLTSLLVAYAPSPRSTSFVHTTHFYSFGAWSLPRSDDNMHHKSVLEWHIVYFRFQEIPTLKIQSRRGETRKKPR